MFFRRGGSGGRWLGVKMWIFGAGAVLALLGMGLQNDWLVGAAALILSSGVLLGFLDRRRSEDPRDD